VTTNTVSILTLQYFAQHAHHKKNIRQFPKSALDSRLISPRSGPRPRFNTAEAEKTKDANNKEKSKVKENNLIQQLIFI